MPLPLQTAQAMTTPEWISVDLDNVELENMKEVIERRDVRRVIRRGRTVVLSQVWRVES